MYGLTPNAKNPNLESVPPEVRFNNEDNVLLSEEYVLIPGKTKKVPN